MYDLIIKNGTVYDGTGDKPFIADIAIKGRKIEAIGELDEVSKQTINAEGKNSGSRIRRYSHSL